MPRNKVLIVTDDAGESFEILYAQHRFREVGFEPVVAATQKKLLNAVIHDFNPGWNTYIEKPGYLIKSDITFDEVNVDDYRAVLLIGGAPRSFCVTIRRSSSSCRRFTSKTSGSCRSATASRSCSPLASGEG
jgi:protease I